MIEFKNVSKVYDKRSAAIQNATFTIHNGDFVFLVGSSGSGKSTIIKMILKEKDPTTGKIYINGTDTTKLKRKQIPFLRRSMGVVFQDFRLIAEKTVYDNVAFAMYMIGANKKHIKRQVPMVLALVGIADKADKKPEELSGGEQQRVAIARALVNNPSMIIADEPTGNLDPETSVEVMQVLKEINASGRTILMATHDYALILKFPSKTLKCDGERIFEVVQRRVKSEE